MPSMWKHLEDWSSPTLLVGKQSSPFPLENNLTASHKVVYKLTVRPRNSASRCVAYKNENTYLHKVLYVNVQNSFIQEPKTRSFPKWLPNSERKD